MSAYRLAYNGSEWRVEVRGNALDLILYWLSGRPYWTPVKLVNGREERGWEQRYLDVVLAQEALAELQILEGERERKRKERWSGV